MFCPCADEASREKERLEEKQRAARKERAKHEEEWSTRWGNAAHTALLRNAELWRNVSSPAGKGWKTATTIN